MDYLHLIHKEDLVEIEIVIFKVGLEIAISHRFVSFIIFILHDIIFDMISILIW